MKTTPAFGMSPKKTHEVEEASQLISSLAAAHGLKQVRNNILCFNSRTTRARTALVFAYELA